MNKEDLIQRYFKNLLSDSEQKKFAYLKKTDASFVEPIKRYADLQAVIKADEKNNLKKRLQQLEVQTITPTKSKYRFWKISIAASITLAIGISSYLLWVNTKAPTDLYATYFAPYPNVVHPVVRSEQTANDIAGIAFLTYENGEYIRAKKSFEQLLKIDNSLDNQFYLAMTLLNKGEETEALQQLELLAQSETKFLPQVYWYKSLIYLRRGDTANARKNLKQLQALKADYKKKEISLLLNQLQ